MVNDYPRWVSERVRDAVKDTPVVVLQGARQTGKSTLVTVIARELGATVITLDDADARAAAESDPESFVAAAGDGALVLDEIQRAPQLILPIKAQVDRERRPGRFILTGSADLMRVPGAGDSLAGRAETIRLHPLSQGEIGRRKDDFVTALLRADDLAGWASQWGRSDYIDAICAGGYPTALTRSGARRFTWFADYVGRLLGRDAGELARVDPVRLRRALDLLAAGQSGELVMARLARDLSVAEGTARSDVQRLESLYLLDTVPAWSRSLTRRLVNRPKVNVADSGLAAMLSDLEPLDLASPLGVNHLGGLLEGFVSGELRKQASWSETRFRITHYRESGGAEVDFVIELPGGRIVAVEVKAAASARADHAAGLRLLRDRMGSAFVAGIVLHLGERAWSFGDRIWALPVAALWEL